MAKNDSFVLSSKDITTLLRDLESITEVNGIQIVLRGPNIQTFQDTIDLIIDGSSLSEVLKKKKVSRQKVNYFVRKSFEDFRVQSKKVSWSMIKKEVIRRVSLLSEEEFFFIFPINILWEDIRNEGDKGGFHISGTELKVMTFNEFNLSNFNQPEMYVVLKEKYKNTLELMKYQYVSLKIKARDYQFAIESGYEIIETFLGLINLSINYSRRRIFSFPVIDALSKVKTTPFGFYYDSSGKYLNDCYCDDTGFSKSITMRAEERDRFFAFYDKIEKRRTPLKKIIYSVLRTYQEAITEKFFSLSFSKYWTGFEQVLLKTKKISHSELPLRFMKLSGLSKTNVVEKVYIFGLESARMKRNAMLHGNAFEISGNHVNFVKTAVEISLVMVITSKANSLKKLERLLK